MPIIEILVKAGDTVEAEQPLVTLESDKATMDVPSPAAGKITQIVAKVGDKVSMGALIAKLDAGGPAAPIASAQEDEAKRRKRRTRPTQPRRSRPGSAARARAGVRPAKRRLLRRLRWPRGSPAGARARPRSQYGQGHRREGPHHPRGCEGGARAAARGGAPAGGGALPAIPAVDFAKFGPVETVPLSRIKRISGPRLHASWVNVPHVTHCDEADITELDAFRKTLDEDAKKDKSKPYRVSLLPLLMRAAVATLKAFPTFNAALSPAGDA